MSTKKASNWEKLKNKITTPSSSISSGTTTNTNTTNTNSTNTTNNTSKNDKKRKRNEINEAIIKLKSSSSSNSNSSSSSSSSVKSQENIKAEDKDKYIGLDCEMVGLGPSGKQNALARCCLVDFDGNKIYDKFVRPPGLITDFRTQWSGVRRKDLRKGEAISLEECQNEVAALIKNKILIGHALKNDLDVLMLGHPRKMIRDTASYRFFMRPKGRDGGKFRPRALRDLVKQHFDMTIQTGEHDPGEDARSAVMLYKLKMKDWERELKEARTIKKSKKSTDIKPTTTTGFLGLPADMNKK